MLLSEEGGNKIVEALHELNVQTIVSIPKVGPFDFSITNAVIYMWVSAVIVFLLFFIAAKRSKKEPERLQTIRGDHPQLRHRPSDRARSARRAGSTTT